MPTTLSAEQANHCLKLLISLDTFYLRYQDTKLQKKFQQKPPETTTNFFKPLRTGWFKNRYAFIDRFIRENKDLSQEDIEIIRQWKYGFEDNFIVVQDVDDKYTALFALTIGDFYGAKGLNDPLGNIPQKYQANVVHTRLLPFEDIIIADGIFQIGELEDAREENFLSLKAFCEDAVKSNEIIIHLDPRHSLQTYLPLLQMKHMHR